MGSLTSRPKAAPSPQIVYVPAPVPTIAPRPAPTTITQPTATSDTPSAEQKSQEQREDNLLRRDRGRSGTVQTSFRGILNAVNDAAQKKTLLGQ